MCPTLPATPPAAPTAVSVRTRLGSRFHMDAETVAGHESAASLGPEGKYVVSGVGRARSPAKSSTAFAAVIEANPESVQRDRDEFGAHPAVRLKGDDHCFRAGEALRAAVPIAVSAIPPRGLAGFCARLDLYLLARANPLLALAGLGEMGQGGTKDRRRSRAFVLPDDPLAVDIRFGLGCHLRGQSLNWAPAQHAVVFAVKDVAGFVAHLPIPNQTIARQLRGSVAYVGRNLERRAGAGFGVEFAEQERLLSVQAELDPRHQTTGNRYP